MGKNHPKKLKIMIPKALYINISLGKLKNIVSLYFGSISPYNTTPNGS